MTDIKPEGIGDIIEAMKTSGSLGRNLQEARIWERWPEIVGPKLMPYGQPLGVRDETLFIQVESAVWMHKFSYQKPYIIQQVNKLVGHDLVSEIFLTLDPDDKAKPPEEGA